MAVIAFYTNTLRPEAAALAERATAWLSGHGHQSFAALRPAGSLVSLDDADLLVSLGGDGTLLRAVDAALSSELPVLGVNLGRLGYLTQVEPADLENALASFLEETHQVEERMTLEVTVRDAGGQVMAQRAALNEASVEKTVPGHTIRIAAVIDDRPFVTYAADGLLVSTPTGSTAYNLSARGPVLSPRLRAIVVTPVSPHMLFDRALVLDPEQRLRFEVLEPRPAVLVVDGVTVAILEPGASVDCREGGRPARLVTFGARDFHAILRAKFHLADR
jgi:NAD+ kinase